VADSNAAAPFDRIIGDNDNELVQEVLATLNARESRILAMRFGLDDRKPKILEEIAERFGVTRERIRQIQKQALRKMRVKIGERDHQSAALAAGISKKLAASRTLAPKPVCHKMHVRSHLEAVAKHREDAF